MKAMNRCDVTHRSEVSVDLFSTVTQDAFLLLHILLIF